MPFVGSAMVAYTPSPILRVAANPLSSSGTAATRASCCNASARSAAGRNFVQASAAPAHVAEVRKFRRVQFIELRMLPPLFVRIRFGWKE
ncbi:MAG TPA: hypothetical protein VGQ11_03935 [Candidatus Acidoferrales bacterium]|nr:hypothetical protein [Candidatus Acidoferrales bacterium]